MTKPTYEELQAQVERLRDAANRLSFGLVHDEPEWNPSTATSSAFSELQDAISETPAQSLAALKAQWNCPTIENGQNRYGLDVAYFRRLFNRELNRSLSNYKPSELARNLLRMARTADNSIIAEDEFTGELKKQWQAEAIKRVMRECDSYRLQEMPGYGIMVWDIEEILKELDGTQEPTND